MPSACRALSARTSRDQSRSDAMRIGRLRDRARLMEANLNLSHEEMAQWVMSNSNREVRPTELDSRGNASATRAHGSSRKTVKKACIHIWKSMMRRVRRRRALLQCYFDKWVEAIPPMRVIEIAVLWNAPTRGNGQTASLSSAGEGNQ